MMTFDEFKLLANNPPRKEEPTIFKVVVYGIDTSERSQESENGDNESPKKREFYSEFPLYCFHEVLSSTLSDAEAIMMRLLQDVANAYCAVITELPFGEDIHSDYVSSRLYDACGVLLEQSLCSSYFNEERDDYRHFRGRTPEQTRFAKGDIVEVRYGNAVELAIVVGVPASVEWCYQYGLRVMNHMRKRCPGMSEDELGRLAFSKWYMLDDTDDSYTVINQPAQAYNYSNGKQEFYWPHDHVSGQCLMKPRFPIPKQIEKEFSTYYQQFISS